MRTKGVSEVQFSLLAGIDAAPVQVAVWSAEDRLVWCNQSFREAWLRGRDLGISFADMLRVDFHDGVGIRIDCGDIEAFLADMQPRRDRAGRRSFATDRVDGQWCWVTETRTADGSLVAVLSDITSLKTTEAALRVAHAAALVEARTDTLTGLPNRRAILDVAAAEALAAVDRGATCAVAVFDLDAFKAINDTVGHPGGDAVLVHFARAAAEFFRRRDRLGRTGGDEFLLVLADASVGQAVAAVDRFRSQLPSLSAAAGVPIYSFSAGVVTASAGESVEELLARADTQLYTAKRRGGACTVG